MPDRRFKKPYPRAECIDDHEYLGADENGFLCAAKPGARFLVSLTIGKVYEVRGERMGMWAILDNTNEVYLYPKSHFRFLDPEPSSE